MVHKTERYFISPSISSTPPARMACAAASPPSPAFALSSVRPPNPLAGSPSLLLLIRSPPPPRSALVASARRRTNITPTTRTAPPKPVETPSQDDDVEADDLDEDAFEALFSQLEEDLKNDNLVDNDTEDEISEEDLAKLAQELDEALDSDENDVVSEGSPLDSDNLDDENDFEKEENLPKLKTWQLKRMARALKTGRRKTSIKTLAAELALDRPLVLSLLRDPPPSLLLMCASLPDEETRPHPETKEPVESSLTAVSYPDSKPDVEVPVHVQQRRWIMQKRLKKVHVETLERVYLRTKRPTNAMISSIVHLTNLPWKRVVKWFEEKRLEDGIPEQRVAFRRSVRA